VPRPKPVVAYPHSIKSKMLEAGSIRIPRLIREVGCVIAVEGGGCWQTVTCVFCCRKKSCKDPFVVKIP
jgi:hypothetical protein